MLLDVLSVLILFLLGVLVGMIIENSFHSQKQEPKQQEHEEQQKDFFEPF